MSLETPYSAFFEMWLNLLLPLTMTSPYYHQNVNNWKVQFGRIIPREWLQGKWLCSPQVNICRIRCISGKRCRQKGRGGTGIPLPEESFLKWYIYRRFSYFFTVLTRKKLFAFLINIFTDVEIQKGIFFIDFQYTWPVVNIKINGIYAIYNIICFSSSEKSIYSVCENIQTCEFCPM